MQFISKSEFYLFVLAAITLALVYNVAASNLLKSGSGAANSLLAKVLGQNSAGNFQKPF